MYLKKISNSVLKSLNNYENKIVKNLIFYFFILILFLFFILVFYSSNKGFPLYPYTELMINYSHGFVRRGLPGTILIFLQKEYNINLFHKPLMALGCSIYLLFTSIYIFKVKQSQKVLNGETMMVFLFLPSLIIFPINDLWGIGRKEFFFFFGLLINLFFTSIFVKSYKQLNSQEKYNSISNSFLRKYCFNVFVFYNLLSIPTALSHEAILFLGLPINMIITATVIGFYFPIKTVLVRTFLIYLPTIFVSCLALIFNGNAEIALGICQSWVGYESWKEEYKLISDCAKKLPRALAYFAQTISDSIELVLETNVWRQNGKSFVSWVFAFIVNTIILMRASTKTVGKSVEKINYKLSLNSDNNTLHDRPSVWFSFKYLFLPFICSFILYVIALDWGRWFFIVFISYALCLLTPNLIELEVLASQQNKRILGFLSPIYKLYSKIILYLENIHLSKTFFLIYFIFLIYTLFFMSILHYKMNVSDLSNGIIPQIYQLIFQ